MTSTRTPREHTRFMSSYLVSQLTKLKEVQRSMEEELTEIQEECLHPEVVALECVDCLSQKTVK